VDRKVRWPVVAFAVAFVALVLDAGGGPGWGDASARAVLAVQQRHLAASPLYDVLANIAALIPAGEPGFRLGILAALIAACTLAGVVAAVSALVPREPSVAFAPLALLAITPAFRDAAAFAQPALLAACGAVWSIAFAARFARTTKTVDGKATRDEKDEAREAAATRDERDASDLVAKRRGGKSASRAKGNKLDARDGGDLAKGEARDVVGARGDRGEDGVARRDRGAGNARDVGARRKVDARNADDVVGASGRLDSRDARDVVCALASCILVVGSLPFLGAAWTVAIGAWLVARRAPRTLVAGSLVAIGLAIVVLWITARGSLPGFVGNAASTLAATGRGPAAIVVGAGLLGIGFGALTRLPNAVWIGLCVGIVAVHDVVVGGSAVALLCVLAVGIAIVPGGIVRAVGLRDWKRHLVGVVAGVPLVGIALATGATLRVEDPGATPAQLARDLEGGLPPGPGVFVATRSTSWLAVDYAAIVGGARPDIALAPPLPSNQSDAIVANTLRAQQIAGADAAAFGRLDSRWAIPRRRGFQLVGAAPEKASPIEGPAKYTTATGLEQSTLLAIERARHEAASDRLDAAARALGFAGNRFGAADLAVLAATTVTKEHPALFGLVPLGDTPVGPWLLDLFGDDLAWVAGIPIPALPADAPMPRRLHAKWRAILEGKAKPDDPEIAAMGPAAVEATKALFRN
jgi:hypothetical protein